jgi:hypothetical protein
LPAWPGPVTTDAEGRFTLRGTGRGQGVSVHTVGNEQVASAVLTFAASDEAEPAAKTFAGGSPYFIEGTVTDAETGRPVPRARVQVEAAGSAHFLGGFSLPADWKGRQGQAGQGVLPSSLPILPVPAARGVSDDSGRFRLGAFWDDYYPRKQFSVIVSGPDDEPYLTVKKTLYWPKGALKQEVRVSLPRGVLVRGRVTEASAGSPLVRVRIDFWSKQLWSQNVHLALRPDGVFHPPPRKTDSAGRFQVIVPPGNCYLLFNGPTPDFVLQKIAAEDLGVDNGEESVPFLPPGKRTGKKHFYYPDEVLPLEYPAGARTPLLKVTLRRAPLLKGRVVGPDGEPAAGATMISGQVPFAEYAHGPFARRYQGRDGRFEIPVRNLDAPLYLACFDAEKQQGAFAEYTAAQARGGPVTVRLGPCGSATARFLDAGGKPLAGYRPLLWLSVPAEPYSEPGDLERLAGQGFVHGGFDAIWAGAADSRRYGDGPRTEAEGRVTFPALVPGATYRVALSGGKARDLKATDKAVDLGDLTVPDPAKTAVPSGK